VSSNARTHAHTHPPPICDSPYIAGTTGITQRVAALRGECLKRDRYRCVISGSHRYSIREFRFVAVQFRNEYLWRGYQIPLECMQSPPTSTLECLGSITRKQRWTIAMSGPPTHPEQKPFYMQSRITMLCPLISPALQVLQHAGRERNHLSWAITSLERFQENRPSDSQHV
jgi:hypothetical protein